MYAHMYFSIQRSKLKAVSMHKHKTQGSLYKEKKFHSCVCACACVHVNKSKSKVKNLNKKIEMQIDTFLASKQHK